MVDIDLHNKHFAKCTEYDIKYVIESLIKYCSKVALHFQQETRKFLNNFVKYLCD